MAKTARLRSEILIDGEAPDWRLAAKMRAAEELYEALKAAQFGFNHRRCSLCGGWNMSANGEKDMVHTKNCVIAKALAKAEGKESSDV